ncbi:hypothetical protein GCM10009304_05170 [Pseudomonas matsuisoli]|uniref:Uncharacterized protein n=1 Tax=Pseudomonas matsuisoli TaxID=1515666 RepID=A0A917PJT8_9PSED|nr:hypothetical protein GCM10009304_05170 [Pseudomonas matsuisoli]
MVIPLPSPATTTEAISRATYAARPFGTDLFLRAALLLTLDLAHQTLRFAPSLAQKQVPARP